jgi:hypothetical protein
MALATVYPPAARVIFGKAPTSRTFTPSLVNTEKQKFESDAVEQPRVAYPLERGTDLDAFGRRRAIAVAGTGSLAVRSTEELFFDALRISVQAPRARKRIAKSLAFRSFMAHVPQHFLKIQLVDSQISVHVECGIA